MFNFQEAAASPLGSPLPERTENDVGMANQEDFTPKKPTKRTIKRKESKKSPVRKKTSAFVARDVNSPETSMNKYNEVSDKKGKKKSPKKVELEDPLSSPSLPSSDSSDDDDDDDEEDSAISRIRQKAAELTKKIKEEKRAAGKAKLKETTKRSRITKMEVETIAEDTIMMDNEKVEPVEKVAGKVEEKPPKTTFRIPKKSNSENGSVSYVISF